jgi:hypothetical protein
MYDRTVPFAAFDKRHQLQGRDSDLRLNLQ